MDTVIYKSKEKIFSFNDRFLKNIALKEFLKTHMFTTIVGKVGLFFTSDLEGHIDMIKRYFLSLSMNDYIGPLVFVNVEDQGCLKLEDVFWMDEKNGVSKGECEDSFLYQYDEQIAKVEKQGHLITLYINRHKDLESFLPYFIKVIEGAIITQHLRLGFLPVHAGLVVKEKKCILILGDSQSGKTSLMKHLSSEGYLLLSDDIVFLDLLGNAYGYGHYQKEMVSDNIEEGAVLEHINHVSRKITKINSEEPKEGYKVTQILITNIKKHLNTSLELVKNKEEVLVDLMNIYPNQYFVNHPFEYGRAVMVVEALCKKEVNRLLLAYNKDYMGVEQLWKKATY